MGYLNKLDLKINNILTVVEQPVSIHGDIDTCSVLYELASKLDWGVDDLQMLDFISKRLDISRKFFLGYHSSGRKAVDIELTNQTWLELAVAILFKVILIRQYYLTTEIHLRRFNTLFKALDIITPKWLLPDSYLGKSLESNWQSFLQILSKINVDRDICRYQNKNGNQNSNNPTTIPLTVLFYEGPIARAYLETIKDLGFKPKKIINLVSSKDVVTKKVVGKWMPKGMRKSYAATIQQNKIHYWPKQLIKKEPKFVNEILNEVQEKLGFSRDCIDSACALSNLSTYSDNVESILVDSLGDQELWEYLSEEPVGTILFTGGGILPVKLLELQNLMFLHIHPGFLPNIRGADCALWSLLLAGHASATCFYMSPGIDTGDIIYSCWLPKLSFDVDTQNVDSKSMYRSVYSFLDPWIRAYVLRIVILNNAQFNTLDAKQQTESDGVTFHFMHQRIQQVIFQKLFG